MALSIKDLSPGAVYKKKTIKAPKMFGGEWVIELIYLKDSGGKINIWQKGASELEHIWTSSDDRKWHKLDEIHFAFNKNARERFTGITSWIKAQNLMTENS